MTYKYKSPLAPKKINKIKAIAGVDLYTFSAGLYNKHRSDIALFIFNEPGSIAEVFTKSSIKSHTLHWNKKNLKSRTVKAIFINAGNANTFTGYQGVKSITELAKKISSQYDIPINKFFVCSTGVIGEPYPIKKILSAISQKKLPNKDWLNSAKAIMTTDTFPKGITRSFKFNGINSYITGISKGSGMIEPNMATMLGFVFIEINIPKTLLQKMLIQVTEDSFNKITVDGDESTNDTVILASTNRLIPNKAIKTLNDPQIRNFKKELKYVFQYLANLIVRDGEGASKLISINVKNAKSEVQAKKIAKSIANSQLFKTAIYGKDANWGRIVMAISKTYEAIDENKLKITFGNYQVTHRGAENKMLNKSKIKNYLKKKEIKIVVDLGLGNKTYDILTCDLSHKYIDINASYKS
tara:strand:- start:2367 stop:3599 length:1233 start_codon:yes stop_codon:yes gene_type:complete